MTSQERYQVYDSFAWFYDRYWSAHYHPLIFPVLFRLLSEKVRPGAKVLDLCCGAGHMTALLAEKGYQMTGLDGSGQMLEYAQKRLPAARWIHADARELEAKDCFEGMICTFDSLNHILSVSDFQTVLRNAFCALRRGGRFIFDLNGERAYLSEWHKSSCIVEKDHVCIVRGHYDPERQLGFTNITLFLLKGGWRRQDIELYQRCYAPESVCAYLNQAGFANAQVYEADAQLRVQGDLGVGRLFFVADKL